MVELLLQAAKYKLQRHRTDNPSVSAPPNVSAHVVKRLILRIPSVYRGTSVSSAKIQMTAQYPRGSGLASIFAPRFLHFSAIHIVQMSVPLKARWCHSLTAVSLGPGLTEVVEFGGSPDPMTGSDKTQPKMADTTLLQFSECPHNLSSS